MEVWMLVAGAGVLSVGSFIGGWHFSHSSAFAALKADVEAIKVKLSHLSLTPSA